MLAFRFKLYRHKRNKRIDTLLAEACFVWNRCLAIQKRYYKLYKQYVSSARMQSHFAKRYHMNTMNSQSVQEVIQRLDMAYRRFFEHKAKRPPKFKKIMDFQSVVFKQSGYKLKGDRLTINSLKTTFRFSVSRKVMGAVKRVCIKKSRLGEYFVSVSTDAEGKRYGKSHDGASVGIDFGLKTYLTLSDGTKVENPQFLKRNLRKLKQAHKKLSRKQKGSKHRTECKKALNRVYEKVSDSRCDWQWKLAHELCRKYDNIYIEDLNLDGMKRLWGRKVSDLAHGEFVSILKQVAWKYGCTVHEIDRYYPSSKTCGKCGHVKENLSLRDRHWVCPECGESHDRDLNAAKNILRRGIDESASTCKSANLVESGGCACSRESHAL